MAPQNFPRKRAKRPSGDGGYWYSANEGRWRAQYPDAQGRLRSLSAKTEAEIVKRLSAAIRDRETGLLGGLPSRTPSVGEWLEHWLAERSDLRPRTVEKYELDIRGRIKPVIGSIRLDKLQPIEVEAMYRRLKEGGLAANTVRHVHAVLHAAYRDAFRLQLVPTNVLERVRAPKSERKEITPPTREQSKAILAAAARKGSRDHARWALALRWGVRQGEAAGLRWQDVNLETGEVQVRQALQRQRGNGLVTERPKSRAGERNFVLDADTIRLLKNWRKEQAQQRLLLGQWPDHDLIFTGRAGAKQDPHNEWRSWKRLLEDAGIPHFRIHDARHAAASNMIEAGVNHRVVMEVIGHSQISLTLNTYAHVSNAALHDTAAKVASLIM